MGDEETTEVQDPTPDPAALLEQERAERLRLEGENRHLREQQARPQPLQPESTSEKPLTAQDIEKLVNSGELTQFQTARLLAKIEGREAILSLEQEREQQTAVQRANTKIAVAVRDHPELKDRQSPLMQRVAAELRTVETDYGMNPEDPRAQALAIERILGSGRRGDSMDEDRDYDRLRRVGESGRFSAGDEGFDRHRQQPKKSKGERLFDALLPEFQQFYINLRGSKESAVKTLEYADEAGLRKAGRLA